MGASGSGKNTVANALNKMYGLKVLDSYTTRPPRYEGEKGHIFISGQEFDKIPKSDMIAYTEYNGNKYCATKQQLEEADIYIIDPAGVKYFKATYDGNIKPIVVYLTVSAREREQRMIQRKDSEDNIKSRLEYDKDEFAEAEELADYIIENESSLLTAKKIWRLLISN